MIQERKENLRQGERPWIDGSLFDPNSCAPPRLQRFWLNHPKDDHSRELYIDHEIRHILQNLCINTQGQIPVNEGMKLAPYCRNDSIQWNEMELELSGIRCSPEDKLTPAV